MSARTNKMFGKIPENPTGNGFILDQATQSPREHLEEEKASYGVATRSKMMERYDLIPAIGHQAEAFRYGLGANKHGEGNWKQGDKQFVKQLFNHMQNHYTDLLKTASNEHRENVFANCGAIKWAASCILWYNVYRPDVFIEALREIQSGLVEKQ